MSKTEATSSDPASRNLDGLLPRLEALCKDVHSHPERLARPEEIAGMVLFLCSPSASCATGGVYMVDGGQSAH